MSVSISGEGSVTGIDQGLNVVGVVTATQVKVGSAVTIHSGGFQVGSSDIHSTGLTVNQINATGVVTATSFVGSGANLTGIAATTNVVTNSLVVSGVSTFATGSVSAPSISPSGDSNTGIFFPAADTIAFGEGGVEAARIDSSGRLGLGVNSPSSKLHVIGGTTSGSVDTAAIFTGGVINTIGSGARIYLSGVPGFETTRGTYIEGVFDTATNAHSLRFATNASTSDPVERARIDSSGRLLIGTTTQNTGDSKLLVSGANPNLRIESTSYPNGFSELHFTAPANNGITTPVRTKIQFAHDTGDAGWSGSLRFFVGGFADTERMRITNDGYVGIGATARLGNGGIFFRNNVSAGAGEISFNRADTSSTSFVVVFYNNSNLVGSITHTNVATAYNTSSDYRLKENVTAVTDGITRLQQLKPSRFNFIVDPDKTVDGFIAHEVQSVVPEAITGEKDAVDEDGKPIYQGIDQSKLVPLLTAALQEAVAKIESLEAQNATLTARLDAAGL